jgi:hypothetical protein
MGGKVDLKKVDLEEVDLRAIGTEERRSAAAGLAA